MLAVVGLEPVEGHPRYYAEAARLDQLGEYSASSPDELLTPTTVYTYYFPAIYHNYTVPTWQSLGLRGIWVRAIAFDPDGVLYAGTNGHGLYKSTDFGNNWHPINNGLWENATIIQVEVDPFDPQTVYVSSNHAYPWFFYSHDGGESWHPGGYNSHPLLELEAYPACPGCLFTGDTVLDWAGGRLYKSDDGGLDWTMVITGQIMVNSIATSVSSLSPVYAGADRGLYRSKDGGDTWTQLIDDLPDSSVRTVALHPTAPLTAYVGVDAAIYKTTDGGDSWSLWGSDLPPYGVYNLLVNRDNLEIHYATSGPAGVYVSVDEGRHWQAMNAGLNNLNVYALELNQAASHLFAATADGVWALRLIEENER
jgi:photosystem II stability/assembly factor-like uncharacterized protein